MFRMMPAFMIVAALVDSAFAFSLAQQRSTSGAFHEIRKLQGHASRTLLAETSEQKMQQDAEDELLHRRQVVGKNIPEDDVQFDSWTNPSAKEAQADSDETSTHSSVSMSGVNTSAFTEEDYQAVAAFGDDTVMASFVKQLLAAEGKQVSPGEDTQLEGFVPWFSGAAATQNLRQLRSELSRQAWVQDIADEDIDSGRKPKVVGKSAENYVAWNDFGLDPDVSAPILSSDFGLDYVNWSLCNVTTHSNIAGVGPDSGEESIRFHSIATAGGNQLDLVVTANSSYTARNILINGLVSEDTCFGAVNLRSKAIGYNSVDLLFTFYLTGTNTSVTLDKFFFTVYDFDSSATATEQATFFNRVDEIYYVPDHEMEITGALSSHLGLTFSSAEQGTGKDNPQDPMNMTAEQMRRAVMVHYVKTPQFRIKFGVVGGKSGRNFAFAGMSNLPIATAATTTTTTLPPKKPTTTQGGGGGDQTPLPTAFPTPSPTPSPPPTTTSTTTCYMQSCQVWADPHVSGFDNDDNQGPRYLALLGSAEVGLHTSRLGMHTFDGRPVDVDAYDSGDFWLVKSEPVHIQARFRRSGEFVPDMAAIGAIAVGGPFITGRKIIVEPLDGEVTVDGIVLPGEGTWSDPAAGMHVRLSGDEVVADLPMGVKLSCRRWNKHIDVKITMPKMPGGVDGECGNYDGIAENDEEASVQERIGDVRVDESMLLFDSKFISGQ